MNRRIARAFAVVAAAGATVLTLGMMGAASAAPAPVSTTLVPAYYTNTHAGYVTGGGWHIRFITASVKMPAAPTYPGNMSAATIQLRGGPYMAMIKVLPGGSYQKVSYYDQHFASGIFHLTTKVGDTLNISIYRDQWTGVDHFTVIDTTNGRIRVAEVKTVKSLVPAHAAISCWINNKTVVAPHPADVRLWNFKDTNLTSYNGTHGTIFGRWSTHQVIDTVTGTATGRVVMYPAYPSNDGQNFGVWLNHR